MRKPHNRFHIINRAYSVGGVSGGHDLRARIDFARKVVHVQRAIFLVNISELNFDPALLKCTPRRDVGIMIEMREHDFIAWFKLTPDGLAHGKG